MDFFGRRVIYTDESEITRANVLDVLNDAINVHRQNRTEIDYLYQYYKGKQPILDRTKAIRSDIDNKVVCNRANEIVSFKTGYLMGEPVQYVSRGEDEDTVEKVKLLNSYMYSEGRQSKDMSIANWFHICGTSYKMAFPDDEEKDGEDESPFEIYVLDPRNTFVVYYSGLGNRPLMGVTYVVRTTDLKEIYSVYTKDEYFEIVDGEIAKSNRHLIGDVPIVEYPANDARLGAFEIVISMLDAINTTESNRVDGVEQFIQALMVFKGVDIDDDTFNHLREMGGIKVPENGDVSYLIQELNQTQTQTVVDDLYQAVLTICGMPNRNGGSSTSDTGSAVIMRDGWSDAEARAKDSERMFKDSEMKFLKIVINLCNNLRQTEFKLSDVDIRFTRRNYENILQKSQVLTTMLANEKIAPQLAFTHCGLFIDPDLAYSMSKQYIEEQEKKNAVVLPDVEETEETTEITKTEDVQVTEDEE